MGVVFRVPVNKPHPDRKADNASRCGHQRTFQFVRKIIAQIIK